MLLATLYPSALFCLPYPACFEKIPPEAIWPRFVLTTQFVVPKSIKCGFQKFLPHIYVIQILQHSQQSRFLSYSITLLTYRYISDVSCNNCDRLNNLIYIRTPFSLLFASADLYLLLQGCPYVWAA